jgi:hypothetical protein
MLGVMTVLVSAHGAEDGRMSNVDKGRLSCRA